MTETTTEGIEVRSPNRPLQPDAEAHLEEYGIVDTIESESSGRNGGVIVEERPPLSLIREHELTVPPIVVYEDSNGNEYSIYEEQVVVGNSDASIDPADAIQKAEYEMKDEFTVVEGDARDFYDVDVTEEVQNSDPEEVIKIEYSISVGNHPYKPFTLQLFFDGRAGLYWFDDKLFRQFSDQIENDENTSQDSYQEVVVTDECPSQVESWVPPIRKLHELSEREVQRFVNWCAIADGNNGDSTYEVEWDPLATRETEKMQNALLMVSPTKTDVKHAIEQYAPPSMNTLPVELLAETVEELFAKGCE